MRICIVLCLLLLAVAGSPFNNARIHGGTITSIDDYPEMAVILDNRNTPPGVFFMWCGGTIINNRSILTAAHCVEDARPDNQITRVGSTFFNNGGYVHAISSFIVHPDNNVISTMDSEVAIIRIVGSFTFNDVVRPGSIAGPNYSIADNEEVWAVGWGAMETGAPSVNLRHVKLYIINQEICRGRFFVPVTDNMICAGILDVDGFGQCSGDSGGPVFHNKVVIGLTSWSYAYATPHDNARIHGGTITSINDYPEMAVILDNRYSPTGVYSMWCGGTIINNRSILTAAHCVEDIRPDNQITRVGSTYANSGGHVHQVSAFIIHPEYNVASYMDSEVAIIRIVGSFTFSDVIQPGSIAGSNYNIPDNAEVWAAGWGAIETGGASEELRHVQIYTINQDVCRSRYGVSVTENMICAGVLDEGGRGQCSGDSGGPLFHNGVVIGITSWSAGCGSPMYPTVNVRVSKFTQWITQNA